MPIHRCGGSDLQAFPPPEVAFRLFCRTLSQNAFASSSEFDEAPTFRDQLLRQTLIGFCSDLVGQLTQARGVPSSFPQDCLFVGTTHGSCKVRRS